MCCLPGVIPGNLRWPSFTPSHCAFCWLFGLGALPVCWPWLFVRGCLRAIALPFSPGLQQLPPAIVPGFGLTPLPVAQAATVEVPVDGAIPHGEISVRNDRRRSEAHPCESDIQAKTIMHKTFTQTPAFDLKLRTNSVNTQARPWQVSCEHKAMTFSTHVHVNLSQSRIAYESLTCTHVCLHVHTCTYV